MNDQPDVSMPDDPVDLPVDDQPEQPTTPAEHTSELMAADMRPDEPMAEAVRTIMYRQYQVMVANEAACRSGKSIDAVHDMRVATRRTRVAFKLFGAYYRRGAVRSYETELRKTGRTLGAVRDQDVFNKTARQYLRSLPKPQRASLDPLLGSWKNQRQGAHRQLVGYLDSPRYRRFLQDFEEFLTTPGAGVAGKSSGPAAGPQVRHVLGSTVWQLYEAMRAYEAVLPTTEPATLHALRIQCKYLRYTLEFFQEVLGHGTVPVVRQVITVQNHLGEIQDAEVASRLLAEYLSKAFRQQAAASTPDVVDLDGVTRYLSYRREQARQMTTTFPQMWEQINSVKFRRRLAAILVAL